MTYEIITRKRIFENTLKLCNKIEKLKNAITIAKMQQYVVKDEKEVDIDSKPYYDVKANIVVSNERSFEAAKKYEKQRVCVLNFASSLNPGGGVAKGSNAQEESLCRCSTLYPDLYTNEIINQFYSIHRKAIRYNKMNYLYNDDCIFTPNVVVFKTDEKWPRLMKQENWYDVDVITCAAPNLRKGYKRYMENGEVIISDEELKRIITKRVKKILSIAKKEREDVVILGAFGCGAFKNPPTIVAEAMKEAIKEFEYDFKTIEFAVYCPENNTRNYDVFKDILTQ